MECVIPSAQDLDRTAITSNKVLIFLLTKPEELEVAAAAVGIVEDIAGIGSQERAGQTRTFRASFSVEISLHMNCLSTTVLGKLLSTIFLVLVREGSEKSAPWRLGEIETGRWGGASPNFGTKTPGGAGNSTSLKNVHGRQFILKIKENQLDLSETFLT